MKMRSYMGAALLAALACACRLPDRVSVHAGSQDHPFWERGGPDTVESAWVEVGGEWDLRPQRVIVVREERP